MSYDPWGVSTLPAVPAGALPPLPPRLADLAALEARGERRFLEPGEDFAFVRASELPEVDSLIADGWHVAPDNPMEHCLAAVWPPEHRCWVPDRLPQISHGYGGGREWIEPWDDEDRALVQADLADVAEECGLPEPPADRLWLLRSPWPTLGLDVVLNLIGRLRDEQDRDDDAVATTRAAAELLTWDEGRVWAWWRGPSAEVAHAWRSEGRFGDDVAGLVLAGLDPEMTRRLQAPIVDGGAGLTEEQAAAWALATDTTGRGAVEAILAWRAVGMPADPPTDHNMVLMSLTPADFDEWLAAGFTFDDVQVWHPDPLSAAVRWREAGFSLTQAQELMDADRAVTPAEAASFDDAGVDSRARLAWLATGFTAAEARAWTDLDVLPQEARVWRSIGKSPTHARSHRAAGGDPVPPDANNLGWFGYSSDRSARVYDVTDPPGTRGSVAAEAESRRRRPRM